MLNLRQLSHADDQGISNGRHASVLSITFRVPSDFLGNIGESLDHSQSERMNEDEDNCHCETKEPQGELGQGFVQQAGLTRSGASFALP